MLGWGEWPTGGARNGDKFTLYQNFALKEGGGGGELNSECVRIYQYAVKTVDMDSPPVVVVVATVLGSWVERATILTVYASLVLPVMVTSEPEVLAPPTVTLPMSAPPLVSS